MKKVLMFHFEGCPYCAEARRWIGELKAAHPELRKVEIEMVDEKKEPARADQYDYYYVPTFYIDGAKVHEGAATREMIEDVLRRAL